MASFRDSGSLWVGCFLFGLGVGWYFLGDISITWNLFSLFLILIGGSLVLSGIFRWFIPQLNLDRVVSGLSGGLIVALLLTQGIGMIDLLSNLDNWGNQFTSIDSKTYNGGILEQGVYLNYKNINGHVYVSTWDKNEYKVELSIKAHGSSQSEADENLSNLVINFINKSQNNRLELTFSYSSTKPLSKYSINVDVKLPNSKINDIIVESSNGELSLDNIQSHYIVLTTSNGAIRLNYVKSESILCATSNSVITGIVNSINFEANTSNGKIDLNVLNERSGTFIVNTSNASVKIVGKYGVGYNVDASTSNNAVTFNLPNLTYSKNTQTSKIAKSANYDTANVKLSMTIRTSNASVEVSTTSSSIY
jgi:hypothetical protein